MAVSDHVDLPTFMEGVKKRNAGQPEFCQAVQEVAEDIFDFIQDKEEYHRQQILRRIAEPDRVISFRVCWEDDAGHVRVQRGWRVQNNNAIGPYKGGIRFHPSVTESVLKFLAFEQTFKNALTGTLTITLKPGGAGTRIVMEYVVGGYMRYKSDEIAPAVDKVLAEQLAGLAASLGTPVEVADPVAEPAKPKAKAKP